MTSQRDLLTMGLPTQGCLQLGHSLNRPEQARQVLWPLVQMVMGFLVSSERRM